MSRTLVIGYIHAGLIALKEILDKVKIYINSIRMRADGTKQLIRINYN